MEDGRSALRYSVRREPDLAVLEVSGELDLGNVDDLRQVALDIFATGQPNLALDLSGVTFIDSTGIGAVGRER
jgi:anti-anti-sigma factor